MTETLQINPKFEQIIPPLSDEEFTQLEENILKVGRVTDPIQVWNGVIIDGHHRYKIVQKHPEIPFSTYNLDFESEFEAIAWMCSAQLGRRNITEAHRQYLIGKRYDAEKGYWGGARRGNQQFSSGEIRHLKARESIAKDTNTSDSYVKYADLFAKGIDLAESIDPGIKHDILNGIITPSKMEIYELSKLQGDDLIQAVRNLRIPKEQRRNQLQEIAAEIEKEFENGAEQETEQETEQEADPVISPGSSLTAMSTELKPKEAPADTGKSEEREIEECILESMIGAVNMFIDSINNYLSRFPRLRTDPKYRGYTREIMVAARDYINDVEGDLL